MSRVPRPIAVMLAGLAAGAVLLTGCTSADSPVAGTGAVAAEPAVRVGDADSVAALLASEPDRIVLDVRTPQEFAAGHLEGAVLVDFNAPDFAERIAEFDPDADYVIYCRSGNRSSGARAVMAEQGFSDVVDVDGGILAWEQAGLPITAG